jgi:hypothetical protein
MCSEGHPLLYYDSGYRADVRRLLDGHGFFECRQCSPSTYFLAVASKISGIADVTCYDLCREDFAHWDKSEDPTPRTPELLYHLRDRDGRNHNPYFLPTVRRAE